MFISENYTIPAGTQTPIMSFIMHRNPKVFPNPEEFNPDHFLPENVVNRHPFAYIPFSAGPRSCIGENCLILLLKISRISHYNLSAVLLFFWYLIFRLVWYFFSYDPVVCLVFKSPGVITYFLFNLFSLSLASSTLLFVISPLYQTNQKSQFHLKMVAKLAIET